MLIDQQGDFFQILAVMYLFCGKDQFGLYSEMTDKGQMTNSVSLLFGHRFLDSFWVPKSLD